MVGDTGGTAPATGSQTISRAIQILRLVACGQETGVRLTDLVHMSGLNRPTVHRILKTLVGEGAVEQDPFSRRYLIGPEISLLGIARTRRFPLMSVAHGSLAELASTVGDTVFLSIRHGLDSICIGRQTGHHPIQVLSIDVGARRPLGVGVSGLAILSCLSPESVLEIVCANEARLALHNLSVSSLMSSVDTARDVGYAYTSSGVMPGTRALSVPVRTETGTVLAALTITAMADRLDHERLPLIVDLMLQQSLRISRHHSEVLRGRQPA